MHVQTYVEYPKYTTPHYEMIARMLHWPQEKIMILLMSDAQSTKECTMKYLIDKRTDYDIFDQICKDNDMYLHVKQHKSKRDGQGAYYTIHSRWLGPNHVSARASEAEMASQMSTCD